MGLDVTQYQIIIVSKCSLLPSLLVSWQTGLPWEPHSQSSTAREQWFSGVLVPEPLLLLKFEDSKCFCLHRLYLLTVYVNLEIKAEKNFKYLPIHF